MPYTCLLIDTNVWLDGFLPHRRGHDVARELLGKALERNIPLAYAVGTIKDVSFLASAGMKDLFRSQNEGLNEQSAIVARQFAWSCVQSMRRIATAVGADESDMWLAEKYHAIHPDFEDDLVLAAAKRCGADYLVTNDQKLIQHAPVPAMLPSDLLALLCELEG